ncbi:MAG: hypothetical protein ALECFALPRED_000325 [Alectoria fallacina]|uniref:Uncharacterized protein n=1 Tax=Alectoria fallacina TaxID=1903189 RepID=A0A8H3JAI4_9LECA|nr:MAG: hypothetical protein ALECFALPRED_000325 [Alectoria fallacina]
MLTSIYAAVWTLTFLTQALAGKMEPALAPRAPTDAASTSVVLGTASGGALDPKATRPPTADQVDFSGDLLLNIVNQQGYALSIFYGSNSPPSISGNPGSGVLAASATTQVAVPTLFAGRVIIGPDYDVKASKIEWNWTNVPDVDVSYVDGYSIPITCSCQGVAVTGSLWHDGIACPQVVAGVCYNPEWDVPAGPANAFFAPCQGSAYTFPDDNGANAWNQCNSGVIDCCVGTSCPAPARQPKSKRELNDVERRHLHGRGEAE